MFRICWDGRRSCVAVEANHEIIARKLLAKSNTDVNKADTNGTTALHVAATLGHANVARLLLARHASSD